MIAPLLVALHLAAIQPPRPIVVRPAPTVERSVAVEERPDGESYVRADRLAAALGGAATVLGDGLRVRVAGRSFDFTIGAPFVRSGENTLPLAAPPVRDSGQTWLPVQFVTDVLPREGRGVLYDADRRELRTFTPRVAASPPPARARARSEPVVKPRTTPVVVEPAATLPTPRVRRSANDPHVVVVDAGHGGIDSGMRGPLGGGPQVDEKVITLGIARQLDAALRRRGVRVVMTRTRDTLVALADRGRIANQGNGELFLSIHVNAANPSLRDAASARGFETYFLAEAKSEDARRVAARENESVRFETATPNASQDPLGFIISDMAQNEHLRESSRLATFVQRRLARAHPGPSRGVKQAGFKVLVTASMPAVLVEVGYGTNASDAAFMNSPAGQRAIAEAIADAAVEYLARAERVGAAEGGTP